jgi:hypothetical protein
MNRPWFSKWRAPGMPTSIASRAAKLMQAVQSGPIRTQWH